MSVYKVDGSLYFVDSCFDELFHYGKGHLDGGHSGRYPWGSGKMPFQHPEEFQAKYRELSQAGYSEKGIADEMGLSINELRIQKSLARNRVRGEKVKQAKDLYAQGLGYTAIGKEMGLSDNSVRSLLNSTSEDNMNAAENTANTLKKLVDEKGMIDVGKGAAQSLGIKETKLADALYICYLDGYEIYNNSMPQPTNRNQRTKTKTLCAPGTPYKDTYNYDDIHTIVEYHSTDDGNTYEKLSFPKSLDSSRIEIIFGDEGGVKKDGIIELRRGVEDISLGGSEYAQVRIAVDDKLYLKGMAIYSDDLPDGVDVRFNTNKNSGTPMNKVLKEMKKDKDGNIDPDNPFGASIKSVSAGGQRWYEDENGEKQLSVINKVKDEGDWDKYSDSLAAQFLVKQSLPLITTQLSKTYSDKASELEEIKNLTNPTLKKNLLLDYADECDGAAVSLKAAALPRQSWQVIIPIPELKDNEIYAPNYKNGEKVALVRYPHASISEIPVLTVNNNHKTGKSVLGQATDAVGINSNVAERLSGADFDGDTVLVIPTNNYIHIDSKDQLEGLIDFDPKAQYKIPYDTKEEGQAAGYKYLEKKNVQREMGEISNLITDMTIKGANSEELTRAIKHSMVIIDAEKHGLDYTRSAKENRIRELKVKYQSHYNDKGNLSTGASTLISRSKSPTQVPERKGNGQIDRYWDPDAGEHGMWISTGKEEGKLYFKETGRTYLEIYNPEKKKWTGTYERDGKYYYKGVDGTYKEAPEGTKVRTREATNERPAMAIVDDAYQLSSGSVKENAYADYANSMKDLAKQARIEYNRTDDIAYNPLAKQVYIAEWNTLTQKLEEAEANAPKERQAQRIANTRIKAKQEAYPEMSEGELKKIKQREMEQARIEIGSKRVTINITDREWEAIQSGAISTNMLNKILKYADSTVVKQLATPRSTETITDTVAKRIQRYYEQNYTAAQIAEQLGLSVSTIYKYINK